MSGKRLSGDAFVVTTRLGVEQFDDVRLAKARLKCVMAEVKRLRRADRRIVHARLVTERGAVPVYLLELTIDAPSGWMAFEIGSAVVRASIHAAGGSTAGWERVEPQVQVGDMTGRYRPALPSSWGEVNAMAARRAAALPSLPPLAGWAAPVPVPVAASPLRTPGIIDLR